MNAVCLSGGKYDIDIQGEDHVKTQGANDSFTSRREVTNQTNMADTLIWSSDLPEL